MDQIIEQEKRVGGLMQFVRGKKHTRENNNLVFDISFTNGYYDISGNQFGTYSSKWMPSTVIPIQVHRHAEYDAGTQTNTEVYFIISGIKYINNRSAYLNEVMRQGDVWQLLSIKNHQNRTTLEFSHADTRFKFRNFS